MGSDDDADCPEHVWQTSEIHLSQMAGAEVVDRCVRCDAVRFIGDDARPSWTASF